VSRSETSHNRRLSAGSVAWAEVAQRGRDRQIQHRLAPGCFVQMLRSQVGGRSVGVYEVNYPASRDFVNSTRAGRDDAREPPVRSSLPASLVAPQTMSSGDRVVCNRADH
jgi:hypothetical protein